MAGFFSLIFLSIRPWIVPIWSITDLYWKYFLTPHFPIPPYAQEKKNRADFHTSQKISTPAWHYAPFSRIRFWAGTFPVTLKYYLWGKGKMVAQKNGEKKIWNPKKGWEILVPTSPLYSNTCITFCVHFPPFSAFFVLYVRYSSRLLQTGNSRSVSSLFLFFFLCQKKVEQCVGWNRGWGEEGGTKCALIFLDCRRVSLASSYYTIRRMEIEKTKVYAGNGRSRLLSFFLKKTSRVREFNTQEIRFKEVYL